MSVGTIDIGTTRVEGPLKVAGAAKYAADQYPPNLLHAVLVGSPIAAGRVTGVESKRAAAVPGVVRILRISPARPKRLPPGEAIPGAGRAPTEGLRQPGPSRVNRREPGELRTHGAGR